MPDTQPLAAARAKKFVVDNFLVLGFCLALTIGLSAPAAGTTIAGWSSGGWSIVQTIAVIIIFIISGATLKTEEIAQALQSGRGALAYGLVSILGVTPLLGFIHINIPYTPVQFRYGLALFCAVPTTLTSGVTLVRNAKGNVALALMLTVSTNLLGVFTVPFYFNAIARSGSSTLGTSASGRDMGSQAVDLLVKLLCTILVPICAGKIAREMIPVIAERAAKHKQELTLTNNSCLIIVVWMSISKSAKQLLSTDAGSIFLVIFAGIATHVVFLAINYGATGALGISGPERVASVMMSSQKTLPVAMTVISYLDEDVFGTSGLIAIPCIICHLTQLFMDAPLATRLAKRFDAEVAAAAAKLTEHPV